MLSAAQKALVLDTMGLVDAVVKTTARQRGYMPEEEYQELRAELSKVLVESANRWPEYCRENGFDPKDIHYFRPFALFRLRGAVIDTQRKNSSLTRQEIKYIQAANKTSPSEAALLFGVSVATIEAALKLRLAILYPEAIEDHSDNLQHEHEEQSWKVMARELSGAPQIVQMYVGLVYVLHLSPKAVRGLLGISHNTLGEFTSYVEYLLVAPVLQAEDQELVAVA